MGERELRWAAARAGVGRDALAEALREAAAGGAATVQKASRVVRFGLGGRRLALKLASAAALEPQVRRDRTRRSLVAEHSFYSSLLEPSACPREELRVPLMLGAELAPPGPADGGAELSLLLEDASAVGPDGVELQQAPAAPGGLGPSASRAAVCWAADMHAHFDGFESTGAAVWPEGGYWSLAKRIRLQEGNWSESLPGLDLTQWVTAKEWDHLQERLGSPVLESLGLRPLGPLRDEEPAWLPFGAALGLSAGALRRRVAQGAAAEHPQRTLLHGDFKAANIFTGGEGTGGNPEEAPEATAVDFQWVGWGLGASDLAYFLATSLSEEALGQRQNLIEVYHARLVRRLGESSDRPRESLPTLGELEAQVDMCLADYARYLVADMWTGVSPESIAKTAPEANAGMHKRSLAHLEAVAATACAALERIDRGGPRFDFPLPRWRTAPAEVWPARQLAFGGASSGSESTPGGLASRDLRVLVARLLSCCVPLAEMAGEIVQSVSSCGNLDVMNKASPSKGAFDPYTEADVAAEKFIAGALQALFPTVAVVGEEGVSGVEVLRGMPPEQQKLIKELERHLDQVAPWEIALPDSAADLTPDDVTVWVDPLDGTRELLAGRKDAVTVLIGVTLGDTPVAGVIHQPFGKSRRTVWGGLGVGVWQHMNGEAPAQAAAVTPPRSSPAGSPLKLATTRSHPGPAIESMVRELAPATAVPMGGAGGKVLQLLDGEADLWVFPKAGTKRWDTAACEALLLALGGFLCDAQGRPYGHSPPIRDRPDNAEGVLAGVHHWEVLRDRLGW